MSGTYTIMQKCPHSSHSVNKQNHDAQTCKQCWPAVFRSECSFKVKYMPWDHHSSGILYSITGCLLPKVSRPHRGLISKGQTSNEELFTGHPTPEDEAPMRFQNIWQQTAMDHSTPEHTVWKPENSRYIHGRLKMHAEIISHTKVSERGMLPNHT